MNCVQAESMIQRFLDHQSDPEEMEQFLKHLEGCSRCRKELETSFFVKKAVEQLDDSAENENINVNKLLKDEMNRAQKRVQRYKVWKTIGFAGSLVFVCATVVFLTALVINVIL